MLSWPRLVGALVVCGILCDATAFSASAGEVNGQIAYTTGHDYPGLAPMDVMLADPDGGRAPHLMTRGVAHASGAAFTPDGRGLVFVEDAPGSAAAQLFSMRVDAEGAHQLTEPYLLPDDHVDPAFAPDGRRIVFASGHTQGDLYTLDRASRGVQRITTDASARSPAYAPDGSRIVFVRRGSGSGTELATLTPTGEDLQLLPVGAGAEWVDWSWATGWIAFSYADSRGLALWDPQGQSSVRPGPSGCCPRFSPDGRQIAYLDGRGELRIWDLAGEATRGLGIRAASRPAWQPLTRPNAPPCDAARLPVRSLRLSATRWKRLAWKGLRDADGDRLSVDLRSAEPQSWNVQVAQFGRRSVAFRIRVGTRLRRARRIRLAYTVVDERGERCDETSTLLVR